MRMYDIIEKKRDHQPLTNKEIEFLINGVTKGEIPDYQISALLMAIYFNGMTADELAHLTLAMVHSGKTIDLSSIEGTKVDKHSTGGVGDKTTLVLIPLVASLGIPIPKMSGRGLGHTGGTLDKVESIPGFKIDLSIDQLIHLVNKHKAAVMGQTDHLVPADKKLYSLRDVTATVNSIPLIASSIMSKKIASGADAFVLDVKTGSGAFMKKVTEARKLAEAMVTIGEKVGKKTVAVISDMSQPLGFAIGNSLEVIEAIETLKGKGPEDVTELCLTLGSQMALLSGKFDHIEQAREQLQHNLETKKALDVFKTMIQAQGGNSAILEYQELLPTSNVTYNILSEKSGYIYSLEANQIGTAAMRLGAGRQTVDDQIDLSAGIILHKKIGDSVKRGEPLFTIHTNKQSTQSIQQDLLKSVRVTKQRPETPPLIYDVIQSDNLP